MCVALQDLKAEHEKRLEQLRQDLQSAAELESQSLCESHRGEIERLQGGLAERDARLAEVRAELASARAALDERGQGLGKAEGELERLREEGRVLVEKEKTGLREIQQLKVETQLCV